LKYEVTLETKAKRQLIKLPDADLRRVIEALDDLTDNPRPLGVKKLKGKHTGMYRIRIGDIRILYVVNDKTRTAQIWELGKRSNVYRKK
jgi:mRNA interferase RelE/StbE